MLRVVLSVLACTIVWPALALADQGEEELAALLERFDQGDGQLDLAKLQSFYAKNKAGALKGVHSAVAGAPVEKPYAEPKEDEQLKGFYVGVPLIRKSFTDIYLFDDPIPAEDAAGAELSFSRDGITDDQVWSLHGVVAWPIGYKGDFGPVLGASFAPFAEFNFDNHSNAPSERTLEFGATGEVGFNMGRWSSYFRSRVGVVRHDVKDYTNVAGSLEWIPVSKSLCLGFPCPLRGTPIIFRFQPSLMLQYDHVTSGLSPFSGQDTAVRLGPVFALNFQPFGPGDSFWNRIVGNVSYHVATELKSRKTFDWFDASLTYNLSEDGHFGVTTTYQRGEDEKTADRIDLFKIVLSGKL